MAHVRRDYLGDWQLKKLQKTCLKREWRSLALSSGRCRKLRGVGVLPLRDLGFEEPVHNRILDVVDLVSSSTVFSGLGVLLPACSPAQKREGRCWSCVASAPSPISKLQAVKRQWKLHYPQCNSHRWAQVPAAPKDHTDDWCPHRPCYWVSPDQDNAYLLSPIRKQKYFHIYFLELEIDFNV